jgi:hypothetical protein
MNRDTQKILDDKRQGRKDLAALPFSEKIAILEKMRKRHDAIAASPLRQNLSRPPESTPSARTSSGC